MVEANIGPIELDYAQLYEGNTWSIDGVESFQLTTSNAEARQIMGLAAAVSVDNDTPIQLLKSNSPWGPIYIDTSNELDDGSYLTHRGWYLISNAEPATDINMDYVTLNVEAYKLSPSEYDYLEMTYTPGVRDGTAIESGYGGITSTVLNEDWSDFDTTNTWYAAATPSVNVLSTPSITSDGSALTLSGESATDGTWGLVYTQSQGLYDAPFTCELDMAISATPAGYDHGLYFFLSPSRKTPGAAWTWNNSLLVGFTAQNTGYSYVGYCVSNGGVWSTIIPATTTSTTPGVKWKLEVDSLSSVTVSLDEGSGYTTKYSGPVTLAGVENLYLGLVFQNRDSTLASMTCQDLQVYTTDGSANNIIALPVCTPATGQTFARESADGSIPCYVNPTAPLYFGQEAGTIYEGCVEGYNSNYQDATPRLVTGTDVALAPDSFYFTNGLIKVTTSSETTTPVLLSVYEATPGAWSDLQIIDPGPVELVKALYVGPDRQTYQVNDTKWTINRGKQHVVVEHPYTSLGYVKGNYYVHDGGTTTTPADNADITMASTYYTNVYNSTEQYRFQIIQVDPVTIKSDSIPAADITGLGFYDNNAAAGSYNHNSEVAGEFFKQPHQKVNMRTL